MRRGDVAGVFSQRNANCAEARGGRFFAVQHELYRGADVLRMVFQEGGTCAARGAGTVRRAVCRVRRWGGSEELLGDGEEAGEDHVAVDHHAQLVGIEPAAEL